MTAWSEEEDTELQHVTSASSPRGHNTDMAVAASADLRPRSVCTRCASAAACASAWLHLLPTVAGNTYKVLMMAGSANFCQFLPIPWDWCGWADPPDPNVAYAP